MKAKRKTAVQAIEQLRNLQGKPSPQVAAYLAFYIQKSGELYWYYRLFPWVTGSEEVNEDDPENMALGVRAGGGLMLLRHSAPCEDVRHITISECERDPDWAEEHPDDFPFSLEIETASNFYKLWFDLRIYSHDQTKVLADLQMAN